MKSDDTGSYSSGSGRYDVFLENYNRGNKYLNDLTESFFEQIKVDKNIIIEKDNGLLKNRFIQIGELEKDPNKTFYQKALVVGTILAPITGEFITTHDPVIKRSGINIINNFLDIAKATEDQQLIDIAVRISGNVQL